MEEISIITLGESAVGKTSIINRIIYKNYEEMIPTISMELLTLTKDYKKKNFHQIKYQFWDTAGAERYNSLTMNYIRDKDIVLLVFCDLETFEVLVKRWYKFIKKNSDISRTKFIVVANKSDTFGDNYEDIRLKGKEFAREINAFFITCSAKSKENIDNLEDHIEYEAIKIIEQREEKKKEESEFKDNNEKKTINRKELEKNNPLCC